MLTTHNYAIHVFKVQFKLKKKTLRQRNNTFQRKLVANIKYKIQFLTLFHYLTTRQMGRQTVRKFFQDCREMKSLVDKNKDEKVTAPYIRKFWKAELGDRRCKTIWFLKRVFEIKNKIKQCHAFRVRWNLG